MPLQLPKQALLGRDIPPRLVMPPLQVSRETERPLPPLRRNNLYLKGDESHPPRHALQQNALTFHSFMIPGLQHDDQWRMVEDEFVATAHRFTAHLHAAEYHRLREMAKKRRKDAPGCTLYPVTDLATDEVKRSHTARSLAISQDSALKRAFSRVKAAEEDDLDETPWAGTHLHDLMESPRKKKISLSRMVSVGAGTRAAALCRSQERSHRERTQSSRSIPGNRPAQARQQQVTVTTNLTFAGDTRQKQDTTADDSGLKNAAKSSASSVSQPMRQARTTMSSTTTRREDCDSDSSVENDFQRLRRDRRKQTSVSRSKTLTRDTSSQANLASDLEKKAGQAKTTKALSVPSI